METIKKKLNYLRETKKLVRNALIEKGVAIDGDMPFRAYAEAIENAQEKIDALVDGSITKYASDKITRIDRAVFFAKDKLTEVIAPNVVEIENEAFRQCSSLVTVQLSPSITNYADNAFNGDALLEMTALPEGLLSLSSSCFRYCARISIKEIPASVVILMDYSLAYCTGITELTFKGDGTEKIYSTALTGCSNLKTINVPWEEGKVANAPWGATKATINYNYTEGGTE